MPHPYRRVAPLDVLLLLMTLIWGTNYAIVKRAFTEIDPQAFNALRMIVASSAFAVVIGWAHVRGGRALHTGTSLPLDGTRPEWELEVVQLDPNDGVWLLDKPPLLKTQKFDRQDEWEARVKHARSSFGGDL